jgi:4-amino-4-deoxy-L-arabinose transferase-like glycosyltransferase
LTSPLHGLVLRGLSLFVSDPIPLYKLLAAFGVFASFTWVVVTYGASRREALPLVAMLVAPNVILWTFAGLETPMLAAIAATMTGIYTHARAHEQRRWLYGLAVLAGVAVLTRYDAVLFAGPVLLAAMVRRRSWHSIVIVGACAALPVLGWFLYSWLHFDAILPTSFYIKTPTAALDVIAINLRYMGEHLLIGGAGLMAVYAAIRVGAAGPVTTTLANELRARWGLHLGLVAVLAYGATMATVHMMFAFRHFAPYAGPAALALAYVARHADDTAPGRSSNRGVYLAAVAALLILVVHAWHFEALYGRSLQGIGTFGEYSQQGTAGYGRDYIPAMMRNAADIRTHWTTLSKGREPRVWTFAAGALPYAYREAYIYEALVSFRHRCPPEEEEGARADGRVWRAHADYIHAFTRHGSLPRLLAPVRGRNVQLISEQPIHFNGRDEKLLVYYNAAPRPHVLPQKIDDPCAAPALTDH